MGIFSFNPNPVEGIIEETFTYGSYGAFLALGLGKGVESIASSATCTTPWGSALMITSGVCHLTSSACFIVAIATQSVAPPASYLCAGIGHGLNWGGKGLNMTATATGR